MKPNTQHLHYFLTLYILFFIVLLATVFQYPAAELHLLMNSNHTAFGDWFFRLWTEWGGLLVPNIILVLLFFYRYSIATYMTVSQLVGFTVSSIAKLAFNEPRPLLYFQQHFPDIALPLVQGVDMYSIHSFPSGHTVTSFALFFGFSLCVRNKWLKLLFFFMAALTGYSRVYLSQHFAADILAGSVIGILSAWACYPILKKMDRDWKKHALTDVFLKKNRAIHAVN